MYPLNNAGDITDPCGSPVRILQLCLLSGCELVFLVDIRTEPAGKAGRHVGVDQLVNKSPDVQGIIGFLEIQGSDQGTCGRFWLV